MKKTPHADTPVAASKTAQRMHLQAKDDQVIRVVPSGLAMITMHNT
jgi:hypothetical protein